MKVFFHIGPHKTGTTAVQRYLLERFGSALPTGEVWYPEPEAMGPGHADLARKIRRNSETYLSSIIQAAKDGGVLKLIISSESFSTVNDGNIEKFANALAGTSVTLVSTQNSLVRRAPSRWQQWVKGHQTDEALDDSTAAILESPGFQTDLLDRFAKILGPDNISIVYSSRQDEPHALIERICGVIGESFSVDSDNEKRFNESLGLVEVEMMRQFNTLMTRHAPDMIGRDFMKLRKPLLAAMRSADWTSICPAVPIQLSAAAQSAVLSRAAEILDSIGRLEAHWTVSEYGPRSCLTES